MVNTLEERFHYQDQAILKDHVLRLKPVCFTSSYSVLGKVKGK